MIANLENIQLIYNDYPNVWVVDGIRIDNYKKSNNHFLHGWREVVIPEITEYQKLGDDYFLAGDIVTKEVIDFTADEIYQSKLSQAIAIDLYYTEKIDNLMIKHFNKVTLANYYGTTYIIPQIALDEMQALKDECNAKILALGITDFTYRQKVPELAKVETIKK